MRIWVTRPEEDAAELAEALRAEGVEVLVEPLLRIVYADGPPLDLAGAQALLATSANGVRAFARRNEQRDVRVLAVGDATARAARAAGFTSVESAAGDVAALAGLAGRRLDPARGPVLHVAATEVAGDLAGALAAAGLGYRREVLYEAWTAERLSDGLAADLGRGAVDAVLVFSPRTGATLVRLLRAVGLSAAARELICFCLSHAVAAAIAPLPWRQVVVAAQPTQTAMIAAIAGEQIPRPGNVDEFALLKRRFRGYSRKIEYRPAACGRRHEQRDDQGSASREGGGTGILRAGRSGGTGGLRNGTGPRPWKRPPRRTRNPTRPPPNV